MMMLLLSSHLGFCQRQKSPKPLYGNGPRPKQIFSRGEISAKIYIGAKTISHMAGITPSCSLDPGAGMTCACY